MTNKTNKLQESLSTLARWKAFIRKNRGFTSDKKDEQLYVKTLHDYQKKWIKDGIGTPLARLTTIDIWEAIEIFNISVNDINCMTDMEDLKLYFDACLELEYTVK